jgi:hypothetical protein
MDFFRPSDVGVASGLLSLSYVGVTPMWPFPFFLHSKKKIFASATESGTLKQRPCF